MFTCILSSLPINKQVRQNFQNVNILIERKLVENCKEQKRLNCPQIFSRINKQSKLTNMNRRSTNYGHPLTYWRTLTEIEQLWPASTDTVLHDRHWPKLFKTAENRPKLTTKYNVWNEKKTKQLENKSSMHLHVESHVRKVEFLQMIMPTMRYLFYERTQIAACRRALSFNNWLLLLSDSSSVRLYCNQVHLYWSRKCRVLLSYLS